MGVFDSYRHAAYPYAFTVTLAVGRIVGGTPTDPKVAEGWIKSRLTENKDDLLAAEVAQIMVERGVTAEEAIQEANILRHLNGFRRDDSGLYIEGRQIKAMIKEAANVRWPKRKWGPSNKGTMGFFAEHVFVAEDRVHLGVESPTAIMQRFVHTWRGTGIQYEEYVDDAKVIFTVESDFEFPEEDWALLFLTGGKQGLGASRSQGFGKFDVMGFEKKEKAEKKATSRKPRAA